MIFFDCFNQTNVCRTLTRENLTVCYQLHLRKRWRRRKGRTEALSEYLFNFLTVQITTQPSFSNTKLLLSSAPMQTSNGLASRFEREHKRETFSIVYCQRRSWSNRINIEMLKWNDKKMKIRRKKRSEGFSLMIFPHDERSPFVWINYQCPHFS